MRRLLLANAVITAGGVFLVCFVGVGGGGEGGGGGAEVVAAFCAVAGARGAFADVGFTRHDQGPDRESEISNDYQGKCGFDFAAHETGGHGKHEEAPQEDHGDEEEIGGGSLHG